jgi:hypothetical protein
VIPGRQSRRRQADGRPTRRDEALRKEARRARIAIEIWRYLAWSVIILAVVGAWYVMAWIIGELGEAAQDWIERRLDRVPG